MRSPKAAQASAVASSRLYFFAIQLLFICSSQQFASAAIVYPLSQTQRRLHDERLHQKPIAAAAATGAIAASAHDRSLALHFVRTLKETNGEWSRYGLQRIVRLSSACSQGYVSWRNARVAADIPLVEAFKDPYTLIEMQVYRKLATLKAKQLNKYVCFSPSAGLFMLKNLYELDINCIFAYTTTTSGRYAFALAVDKSVQLAFDKLGRIVNQNFRSSSSSSSFTDAELGKRGEKNPIGGIECAPNVANVLYMHTKLTDIVSNSLIPLAMAPQQPTAQRRTAPSPPPTTSLRRTTALSAVAVATAATGRSRIVEKSPHRAAASRMQHRQQQHKPGAFAPLLLRNGGGDVRLAQQHQRPSTQIDTSNLFNRLIRNEATAATKRQQRPTVSGTNASPSSSPSPSALSTRKVYRKPVFTAPAYGHRRRLNNGAAARSRQRKHRKQRWMATASSVSSDEALNVRRTRRPDAFDRSRARKRNGKVTAATMSLKQPIQYE